METADMMLRQTDDLDEIKTALSDRYIQVAAYVKPNVPRADIDGVEPDQCENKMSGFNDIASYEAYFRKIITQWGIAPFEVIRLKVRNIDFIPKETVRKEDIIECLDSLEKEMTEEEVEGLIPPARYDRFNRLAPENKGKLGVEARHREWIEVNGRRSRQLVLGTGNSRNPDSYVNFAKDYNSE